MTRLDELWEKPRAAGCAHRGPWISGRIGMAFGNIPLRVELMCQILVREWRAVDGLSSHAVTFRKVFGSRVHIEGVFRHEEQARATTRMKPGSERGWGFCRVRENVNSLVIVR